MKKCKFKLPDGACTLPGSVHKTCNDYCWDMIISQHQDLLVDEHKDLFS